MRPFDVVIQREGRTLCTWRLNDTGADDTRHPLDVVGEVIEWMRLNGDLWRTPPPLPDVDSDV